MMVHLVVKEYIKKYIMKQQFVPYELALNLKELGFNGPCFCIYNREKVLRFNNLNNPSDTNKSVKLTKNNGKYPAPLWQQAAQFLYINSNKQINITINGEDNYERLCEKFEKAIEDFRNL